VADSIISKGVERIKHLSGRAIVIIVLSIVALIFVFQNTGNTQIHVFFWDSDRPLWLWLLLLFAGGFVVGSLFPWFNRRHKPTPPSTPDRPGAERND
jgi:uncharacterized integral membrane protein